MRVGIAVLGFSLVVAVAPPAASTTNDAAKGPCIFVADTLDGNDTFSGDSISGAFSGIHDKTLMKIVRAVVRDDTDQGALDRLKKWCKGHFPKVKAIQKADFVANGGGNLPCMSLKEFYKIRSGMSREDVARIVGSPGTLSVDTNVAGRHDKTYTWSDCDDLGGSGSVQFRNGAEISKAQVGLR